MLFSKYICQGSRMDHIFLTICELNLNFKYLKIWYVGLHFNSCFDLPECLTPDTLSSNMIWGI